MNCITKLSKTIKQTIMQNKLLKITIYLIGFIVIFILMLMISSFAINWLVNTPNPFGLGFIDESNKDTWINFFGAIIGGIATLAGVWLTIKDNNKKSAEQKQDLINQQNLLNQQRQEDLIIQYSPIVNLELYEGLAISNNSFYEIILKGAKEDQNYIRVTFKIKNANIYFCILDSVYFSKLSRIEGLYMDLAQEHKNPKTKFGLEYPLALHNPYYISIKIYYPENVTVIPDINKYSLQIGVQFHNNFKQDIRRNMRFNIEFSIIKTETNELKIEDIEISIIENT